MLNQLYRNAIAFTPHDTNLVTDTTKFDVKGLSVNASGTLVVEFQGQAAAVTLQLTQGVIYPFSVRRVKTGGSATGVTIYG
jgi:hypothetical protein